MTRRLRLAALLAARFPRELTLLQRERHDWLPSPPPTDAVFVKQKKMAESSAGLPPETASYGGGMSRWDKDEAGGGVGAGSSRDSSSWTPYQLGQTDVCFRGERNQPISPNRYLPSTKCLISAQEEHGSSERKAATHSYG